MCPKLCISEEPVHRGLMVHWHAESLASVRSEEADDLATRLAQAKQQLAELGASHPSSPRSQATVSPASDSEQTRHWLPRAISDAASHAMNSSGRLRTAQVRIPRFIAHLYIH